MERTKKASWFDKPMPLKVLYGCCIVLAVLYVVRCLFVMIYDNDMFWMISTGREIIENGIPHTNVWIIDSNSQFIAQQWLYAVALAWFDGLGLMGFPLFVAIQFVLFIGLVIYFFRIKGVSLGKTFFSIMVVLIFCQTYIFSVRPELITLILLLTECISLEKFLKGGNKAFWWLFLLPVTMIAEINVHSSMWVFHYAVLAAYLVPAFYCPSSIKNKLYNKWIILLPFVIAMTGAMWYNPYGSEAVAYVIKSFMAKTFSYISVIEMERPYILSVVTVTLIPAIALAAACIAGKCAESVSLNMLLGFGFLSVYASRNIMFMTIVFLYLTRNAGQAVEGKLKIDWVKDVKNYLYPLFAVGYAFVIYDFAFANADLFTSNLLDGCSENIVDIVEYVRDTRDEDSRIFAGFDSGGLFEYVGVKNVYMDARPELYTAVFTGDKDILANFAAFVCGKAYGMDMSELYERTDYANIDDWMRDYNFDYVVVENETERYLSGYMQASREYERVDEVSGDKYSLYRKAVSDG